MAAVPPLRRRPFLPFLLLAWAPAEIHTVRTGNPVLLPVHPYASARASVCSLRRSMPASIPCLLQAAIITIEDTTPDLAAKLHDRGIRSIGDGENGDPLRIASVSRNWERTFGDLITQARFGICHPHPLSCGISERGVRLLPGAGWNVQGLEDCPQ